MADKEVLVVASEVNVCMQNFNWFLCTITFFPQDVNFNLNSWIIQ